ncbi:MAG: hypothetical protein CVU77_04350 [Elusimicrobia bacterium HGW-Elusimicrobia-1]|jgi:hypothetical protein|nr:MAG: hypothetical protein CVU77_04350 [Elusimicrobia bacterium HGW-Elusimicrobia-1]
MKCEKFEKALILYFDDAVSRADKEKLESHLLECADCKKKLGEYKKIRDLLMESPVRALPPNLLEDTFQKINEVGEDAPIKKLINEIKSILKYPTIKVFIPATAVLILGVILLFREKQMVIKVYPPAETLAKKESENRERAEVVIINTDSLENDFKISESVLLASAKSMTSEESGEPHIRLRGSKTAHGQKVEEEFYNAFEKLNLEFVENIPEIKKIYNRRCLRFNEIRELKAENLVGEGNKAKLIIFDERKLSSGQKRSISEENIDRERLIAAYTERYMKEKNISGDVKKQVAVRMGEILAKVFQGLSTPESLIQASDGKWAKKEKK